MRRVDVPLRIIEAAPRRRRGSLAMTTRPTLALWSIDAGFPTGGPCVELFDLIARTFDSNAQGLLKVDKHFLHSSSAKRVMWWAQGTQKKIGLLLWSSTG